MKLLNQLKSGLFYHLCWSKDLNRFATFIILALTTWIAHFWHSASFGLYEDDYNFIGNIMGMNNSEFLINLKTLILGFPQGRPIGFGIIYLAAFFGTKLGGLPAIYWIGYCINTINAILFYILLYRLLNYQFFALTGALAFALFPADTTQAFLTHIHIYPGLTFLLIAFLCYLSGKNILSYLAILSSLLCYETIFPVFLTAPLLKNLDQPWNTKLLKEFIKHTSILFFIFLGVALIRKILGENRVGELDFYSVIATPVRQMFIGPFISLYTFFYRPFQVLLSLKGEILFFVILSFAGFCLILYRLKIEIPGREKISQSGRLTKLVLIGYTMLVLAYPLTFTVPATEISGRASRVHTAAVIGASIIVACTCSVILLIANRYRLKNLAAVILATFFALLLGFGIMVQQGYQRSWQYQRAFWTDVIHLAPDLTDGTVILVDAPLPGGEHIYPFSWTMPVVLEQIYQFPQDWKFKPKLYKLEPNWQQKIVYDNKFALNNENGSLAYYIEWEPKRLVNSSNVILLEAENGNLVRRRKSIMINDRKYFFKNHDESGTSTFKKNSLYYNLIKKPTEKSINYLN